MRDYKFLSGKVSSQFILSSINNIEVIKFTIELYSLKKSIIVIYKNPIRYKNLNLQGTIYFIGEEKYSPKDKITYFVTDYITNEQHELVIIECFIASEPSISKASSGMSIYKFTCVKPLKIGEIQQKSDAVWYNVAIPVVKFSDANALKIGVAIKLIGKVECFNSVNGRLYRNVTAYSLDKLLNNFDLSHFDIENEIPIQAYS